MPAATVVVLCGFVPGGWAAETITVTADRAEIHADSDAKSRVLTTVGQGTTLEVLRREGSWIRVSTPGTGLGGYILSELTVPGSPPASPSTAVAASGARPQPPPPPAAPTQPAAVAQPAPVARTAAPSQPAAPTVVSRPAPRPPAAEKEPQVSFFAGAGYAKPADLEGGTAFFTGGFRINLSETIALEPEFGYWKKSAGLQDSAGVGLDDAMVGLNVVVGSRKERLGVYCGAGPSLHMSKLSAAVLDVSASETSMEFGGQAFVGADFKVSKPVWLFLSARYEAVAQHSWGDGALKASVSGLKGYGGLRLLF